MITIMLHTTTRDQYPGPLANHDQRSRKRNDRETKRSISSQFRTHRTRSHGYVRQLGTAHILARHAKGNAQR